MPSKKFSFHSRIKSFYYAWAGVRRFIRDEHNAWIHAVGTIAVIVAARVLEVSHMEAIALVIVTALVWITEMLNTCVERMADCISLEERPDIKYIKDLAAAAVLVAALAAVITGLYIFIPKII